MNRRDHTIRAHIRRALAAGILLFTWYALSRVQAGAPEGFALAVVASCGLFILWRAATVAARR